MTGNWKHFDATIYSRPTAKGTERDYRIGITFKPMPSLTVKELIEIIRDLTDLVEIHLGTTVR